MAAQPAEYPFLGYYLYTVFHANEGRYYANLVPMPNSGLNRKTISLARYKMCVKEGRILSPEEQVDHIDNNRMNDDINNLQILTLAENNAKFAKQVHGKKRAALLCPGCGKVFEKDYRNTYAVNGNNYTTCSRECLAKTRRKDFKNEFATPFFDPMHHNILFTYTLRQLPPTQTNNM